MMNYPNPCENCPTGCHDPSVIAKSCDRYRTWINTWWKHFHGYAVRAKRVSQRFRYEHPDIVRRYLMISPCEGCGKAKECDCPCMAYWRWWDARQEWHRNRLK